MARSLRPIEWFNLAKRHGWAQYLLHDDFYDENRIASQPEEDIVQPELFPVPTLAAVSGSADSLLDYAITRWHFDGELGERWRKLPQDDVLRALNSRFDASHNRDVRSVVLKVASVVGPIAGALVCRAWTHYPDGIVFWSLIQATAACLPFEDGYSRTEAALAEMPEQKRRESFSALAHFRSPRALQWIELHAAEPTVEAWGRLAAASGLSWSKVEEWLQAGRPLSLIAIDALLAIAKPQTMFLREHRPRLGEPASETRIREVLEAAAAADPVPRVKQRIGALLAALPALTQSN